MIAASETKGVKTGGSTALSGQAARYGYLQRGCCVLVLACCVCAPLMAEETREELSVWVIWRDRGLEAAFRRFEAEYPAYKIIQGFHTGVTGTGQQKLLTAIAGGAPPDLLIFDRFSVGEWAVRKALAPMNAWIRLSQQQEQWADQALEIVTEGHPPDALEALKQLRESFAAFENSDLYRLLEQLENEIRRDTARDQLVFLAQEIRARCDGIYEEEHYEACWQEATYQGTTCAIPLNADDRALYYNADLLERAGLVDEEGTVVPPRTWKELEEYALKMTEYDDEGNMTRIGFTPQYGNSWLYFYGWQNGGRFMSPDGRTCTLDDPRIVEALQWMTDLYDKLGGVEAVDVFKTSFQTGEFDPFLTGKVAMKIDGDWFLTSIADLAPNLRFGVAPAPVPEGREYITWSGGFSWAIPEGLENPEAAWELCRFLMTERMWKYQAEVNARYYRSRGRAHVPRMSPMPGINAWYDRDYVQGNPDLPPRVRKYYGLFTELMAVSLYRPVTPVGTLLWDEHARAAERAWRHAMTPEEALETGRREVQRQLDLIYSEKEYPDVHWWRTAAIAGGIGIVIAFSIFLIGGRMRLVRQFAAPEGRAALFFAAPWLMGLTFFTGGPVIISFIYSFCRYDVLNPAEWVLFDNYARLLFDDPLFWKSLLNTAYMTIGIPIGMAAGLGIAMLLNTDVRGLKFYRTLFYMPAIVPMVASSILWIWVLNPSNGLINAFLRMFGVSDPPLWLQSPSWIFGSKAAIILMMLWGAGASMIIWLAGLKGIPDHLYEAAKIDGAGPMRRFWNVTVPMLTPYIFFNLIMGVITTMQIFTQAYIMTLGGPNDSTMFYAYYLFNNAFKYFKMGYASSMAWIMMLIICVLTLVQLWLSKKWVYYESD
jgi:ABC-type sugar transport system permease subunit/ABC-type glycerol-3-phosphate transport system substrate-binding protein